MFQMVLAASPAPVIVTDTAPDLWERLLDVLVAAGTLGAVLAALWAAHTARKDADRRAQEDRAAFAERQREEREHDRLLADTRWRLGLLEQLIDAFERWEALNRAHMEAQRERGALVGLVRGYPGNLPVLWHWWVAESSLDDIRAVAREYAGSVDSTSLEDLARLELRHNSKRCGRNSYKGTAAGRQASLQRFASLLLQETQHAQRRAVPVATYLRGPFDSQGEGEAGGTGMIVNCSPGCPRCTLKCRFKNAVSYGACSVTPVPIGTYADGVSRQC